MYTIILLLATLTTGLMAGIFFTWTNAVKPGIGKLDDMGYLQSLQSMNRVILNPTFRVLFFGPVLLIPIATLLQYLVSPNYVFGILVTATLIYWTCAFGVTFMGNIPLNRLLDNTNLETITVEEAQHLRKHIEYKWNRLNLVRTLSSIGTFALLLYLT